MPLYTKETCPVPDKDIVFQAYHDKEWGIPTFNDLAFFEKICLEGFQAGLKWQTILHRRDYFRQAFDDFDPDVISTYTETDSLRLMRNERIIRNRRKILSVINNARRYIQLREENISLAALIWSFEPKQYRRPRVLNRQWLADNTFTTESTALSTELKRRGWSFVGPTTMYALMQALGIVNDHVEGCPHRKRIEILRKTMTRPTMRSSIDSHTE